MSAASAARLVALLCLAPLALAGVAAADDSRSGRELYDYYCYQCHGYGGDARTLAAGYLDPPPRNFRRSDPARLDRARMLRSVAEGRPGTAMAGFGEVLDAAAIARVVDYVRAELLGRGDDHRLRYHSAANGWPDHQRYAAAFPFVSGEIPLDRPWGELDAAQRAGRRLFMRACVSCHDNLGAADAGDDREPIWEARPLSFPRGGFRYDGNPALAVDAYTGASPYARHERAVPADDLDAVARRGRKLFLDNCAFCHGRDGSGRNWIGSFLEPHPRDLRRHRAPAAELRTAIRDGLPGSSMPAWGAVLDAAQINDLIAFLDAAWGALQGDASPADEAADGAGRERNGHAGSGHEHAEHARRPPPVWRRATRSGP